MTHQNIHLIVGKLGSGKTLLMSVFVIIYHLKGKNIYTNYETGKTTKLIKSMDELKQCWGGMLCLDDAYMWISSRDIKGNKGALEVLARSRKRNLDIFLTATRPKQIDINLRYNIQMMWKPICIESPIPGKPPIALIAHGYEFLGEYDDEDKMQGRCLKTITVMGSTLRKIMELYDTKEEINALQK